MRLIRTIGLCIIITCSAYSCNIEKAIYRQKECLPAEKWPIDSPLTFTDVSLAQDKKTVARIFHNQQYGYENIYLKAVAYQKQDTLYEQVFSVSLMNNNGEWSGVSSGSLRYIDYILPKISEDSQPHSLDIYQYSRERALSGITCIELVVQ